MKFRLFYCDLSLFIATGLEIVSIILLISVIETCYKWKNQKEVEKKRRKQK